MVRNPLFGLQWHQEAEIRETGYRHKWNFLAKLYWNHTFNSHGFLFSFCCGLFCFIFKRSWNQSRKGKPENKRKIFKQQRWNIRSVSFFLFVLVRLSRWHLTFIFDTTFIIDIITNSRLTSPQGWFLIWTKTLGWVMVYISHTTNFF